MDSLFAKADAIRPVGSKTRIKRPPSKKHDTTNDHTLHSIARRTSTPKSLQPTPRSSSSSKGKDAVVGEQHNFKHIQSKKLRLELTRQAEHKAQNQQLLEDAEMLLTGEGGAMEVEGEMDRTWRVGQDEIAHSAGQEAAKGRREWRLDGGPYRSRYTRNGRHMAIAGRKGHVATFDWQAGVLHTELQLQETCRDITFLHDLSHFAVAQKKYVYIYDRDGVELHCLKAHIEPTRLEFLPYHWLLATVGNAGYLKYQDTSTGQLLVEHRTKLGVCNTMTQNPHNAVIHLGHQNGTVTLWTPNLSHPAVRLLAHMGPVASVAVDGSSQGRYMATAGVDGHVKIWDCRNWKGAVREWSVRGGGGGGGTTGIGGIELDWSQKGMLAVVNGSHINVYSPPAIKMAHTAHAPPPLYLTHPCVHKPLTSARFIPFQDILTIGHASGLSSILVPGSGEPNFDSTEADPFENRKARREREVRGLLEKIQPDMITLDPDFVGSLAPPVEPKSHNGKQIVETSFARLSRMERLKVSGKVDETEDRMSDDEQAGGDENEGDETRPWKLTKAQKEEREKRKMRGKGKSMKRYLRKQRKNVIDPTAVAIREKLEKQKSERQKERAAALQPASEKKYSALDRFKRPG